MINVLIVAGLLVFTYLCGTFINIEMDFSLWEEGDRICALACWLFASFMAVVGRYAVIEEFKKDKGDLL